MPKQKVLLLGHPVGHSISPRFQQAAFDHLKLPVRYEASDTPEADLKARVRSLREAEYLGANVTVPHKQRVTPLIDEYSDEVRITGATNCLVGTAGRLTGHNTDVGGFRKALLDVGRCNVAGRKVVVFGAGGAARAVVLALCLDGAAEVLVLNRNARRAAQLVSDLESIVKSCLLAGTFDQPFAGAVESCDVLINCTSLGMAGSEFQGQSPLPRGISLKPGALVVDVVANPVWTPLLLQAREQGCATLGGLAMLVYQGALAFSLWTGLPAPVEIMMREARAAMDLD